MYHLTHFVCLVPQILNLIWQPFLRDSNALIRKKKVGHWPYLLVSQFNEVPVCLKSCMSFLSLHSSRLILFRFHWVTKGNDVIRCLYDMNSNAVSKEHVCGLVRDDFIICTNDKENCDSAYSAFCEIWLPASLPPAFNQMLDYLLAFTVLVRKVLVNV
jgi:hypothetical protein